MTLCKPALRAFLLTFLWTVPSPAAAEWLVTPYVGMNWGTNAEFRDVAGAYAQQFQPRLHFGASVLWPRWQPLGLEIDVGLAPDFYGDTGDPDDYQFGNSLVATIMGNLKYDAPFGGRLRPYGSGGIGLIYTRITDPFDLFEVNSTDLGVNVGGGVTAPLGRYAIRGDVRYFRSLEDNQPAGELDVALGPFRFWRATAGMVIRF